MNRSIAIVIDEITSLKWSRDSSLDLARTAVSRGWTTLLVQAEEIKLDAGGVSFSGREVSREGLGNFVHMHESTLDAVISRVDPPLDQRYFATLQLLARVEERTLVMNRPSSLLSHSEKLLPSLLAAPTPEAIVTSSLVEIREFMDVHGRVVIKPLYDYCGSAVYLTDRVDRNLPSVFQMMRRQYPHTPFVIQRHLPEIDDGDRRVFLIWGEPVGAINRRLAPDDFRANMAVGGIAEAYGLGGEEAVILRNLGSRLVELGIYIAGVDMIGSYVTEINFTAPTGHVQVRELTGVDVSQCAIVALERHLDGRSN